MEPEYIGVDLHKQFLQVCALTATGERAWETRWPRSAAGIERVRRIDRTRRRLGIDGETSTFVAR